MFNVGCDKYSMLVHRGPLPEIYGEYRKRAAFVEEHELDSAEGETCFVAISKGIQWPALLISQRFSPCSRGFNPGVLVIPETHCMFVGAGTRITAYRLDTPLRLWEDFVVAGFWGWNRFGGCVLMSAELELTAWNIHGKKLWTTLVEPPWSYATEDGILQLDVMGSKSTFPIARGP